MDTDRELSLLVQPDQWLRCAHEGTALLPGGGVELDWAAEEQVPVRGCAPAPAAGWAPSGLAFDRWCGAYRSRPAAGRVEPGPACPGLLRHPLGLAVDRSQRLYVAESGAAAVVVVDLWAQRLLRRVPVCGRPVDVAAHCGGAVVLTRGPDALVLVAGRRGPRPGPDLVRPDCDPRLEPVRVAPGPYVLWRRQPDGRPAFVAAPDGGAPLQVDGATDIDVTADGLLVVSVGAGDAFARFQREGDGWVELEPLEALDFDGGAATVAPDGRVAFTTQAGYGWTSGSVAVHATTGRVTTYRLDGGTYRLRWGRLFVDACVPTGTSLAARFLTSDLDDVADPVPPSPPSRGARPVPFPDATPPLPSQPLLARAPQLPLYRRPGGGVLSWPPPEPGFATYESPVLAEPGRYLWVQLVLTGTPRATPRVRGLQVERPGHQLLRSLPQAWSSDAAAADFLQRFLQPAEGLLHEVDTAAAQRALLVDPRTVPSDVLPWLGSLAGLVLDPRWPEPARRTLVAETYQLFQRRGTMAVLVRILEIYLGRAPTLIEQWRLRGLGGTTLGTQPGALEAPFVGGSASATGTLGRFTVGGSAPSSDAFGSAAHRFTVLVPGELTPEQREVVEGIVRDHSPAHTDGEVSELGSGMRVGQRLRVRLTSYVGPGTAWGPAVTGAVRVGGDGVVGVPTVGSRLGQDSTTGAVLVG